MKANLLFKLRCGLSLQQSDAKNYSAYIKIELLRYSFWTGFVAEAIVYFPQFPEIYVRAHVTMNIPDADLRAYKKSLKLEKLALHVVKCFIFISANVEQNWSFIDMSSLFQTG